MKKKAKVKISLHKKNTVKHNAKHNPEEPEVHKLPLVNNVIDAGYKNKISYFVLSRFNIHLKEYLKDDKSTWNMTEDVWMDMHLEIMKESLLKSLENQTYKNFQWLCFFDERTSNKHRNIISEIQNNNCFFIPIFVDVSALLQPNFFDPAFQISSREHVYKLSKSDTDFVVQTRIDIDDYIHKDFIKEIKEYAENTNIKKKERQIISFKYGYNLDINIKGEESVLWKRRFKLNQFATLIEEYRENLIGIWVNGHTLLRKHGEFIVLPIDLPMWIWVVNHGANLSTYGYEFPAWRSYDDFILSNDEKKELENDFACNIKKYREIINVYNDNDKM